MPARKKEKTFSLNTNNKAAFSRLKRVNGHRIENFARDRFIQALPVIIKLVIAPLKDLALAYIENLIDGLILFIGKNMIETATFLVLSKNSLKTQDSDKTSLGHSMRTSDLRHVINVFISGKCLRYTNKIFSLAE